MENNNLKKQEILKKEESVLEQPTNFSQSLTNEQKLENLSKLIQDAEENLELNGIRKKLVRKDNN